MTTQLREGDVVGRLVGGCDEVCYSFCLGEVELSVEVGTLCELSRMGHTTTVLYQEFQHLIQYIAGTVTGDFSRVFARVGMGSTENGDEHLINVGNVAVVDGVGLGVGQILGEYAGKNLQRLFS